MPTQTLNKIITSFATLPREVAHQILNDIRIWDILRLICYNDAHINTDILTHPSLGRIVHYDAEILEEVRKTADLYRTVCTAHNLTAAPLSSPLALNTQTFQSDYKEITNYMHHRIIEELYLESWQRAVLAHYTALPAVWDSSTIHGLEARWTAIQDAQMKLNTRKASQLRKAADLLETNSDIVKKMIDPSQTRRKNIPHIVQRLRRTEKQMQWQSLLRGGRLKGMSWFAYELFAVVPFDRALGVVLRGLEGVGVKYELAAEEKVDSERLMRETQGLGEVGGVVRVVVEGLQFVYDGKQAGRLPRIAREEEGDSFYFIPRGPVDAWNYAGEGLARMYEAHDDREIAWLEAFVVVYRYFEARG
ncbi:hypothetical protein BDV38DRAFT_28158 [Aspergillus pseudotamarii]|uniref:Uncharacterized protein n=1 Tax=Aspergillus pseudotamarii TaxID=132259 RepID=A0A5N6T1V1_ASPPS|nr:uncharacterized protein BDV38DRAFT_28158 [Aspergillus pseudotamarii]KAE8140276.1 hypothetical protein BDV38DRAFT_28158 [Aspergillus pseudotamarii]